MRFLFMVFRILLIVMLAALTAAALTGRTRRTYPVLLPEQTLRIQGEDRAVSAWAKDYQPVMMLRSTTFSPPLLFDFYEVVDAKADAARAEVTFVYYHVWEDEIHPNPVYHMLYKIFRAAYYGYPVRDIEFFQVVVDCQTGEVASLMFESSPQQDYYVTLSQHLVQRLTRLETGEFSMTLSQKDGKLLRSQENIPVRFDGRHVMVGAATWNHLTQLVGLNDVEFDTPLPAPLIFLSDAEYRSYKFVRKSQGDFKTKEPPIEWLLGGLGLAVVAAPIYLVMRIFQDKNE